MLFIQQCESLLEKNSLYCLYNTRKIAMLVLREDQFQSSEVIIAAARAGLRIVEVPITVKKRYFGNSKKDKDWKYGLNFAKIILKTWWKPK